MKLRDLIRSGKFKRPGALPINVVIAALLVLFTVYCLCIGKYPVTAGESLQILFGRIFGYTGDWDPLTENVIWGLRVPRILASLLVGGALAVSGAAYQGVFKNPLVSPDFLGVSAGACIGAAIAILLNLGSVLIQTLAFFGGLLAVSITVTIPRLLRSNSNIMLVLSGIIVGGLMGSIMGYMKYVADPETQLAPIIYWTMGSFSYIKLSQLLPILPIIIIPAIVLFRMSWWIDVLSLGESEAQSLGANVRLTRNVVVVCATLMTAGSVCISGTIGWIGLVIPHFARMMVGPANTKLLPTAFLVGALFLLAVDTITRTLGVVEMPISILTGIIGAPFYVWLLYRQRLRLQ